MGEILRMIKSLDILIQQCTACHLCKNNPKDTTPVPGVGPTNAKLMIVGEAPGLDEVFQSEPFVGRCGKLLTKTLEDCGIRRDDCYITNTIKCASRKGGKNVPPHITSQKFCSNKWLWQEVETIRPTVIMTLGNTAFQAIDCFTKRTLSNMINGEPEFFYFSDSRKDGYYAVANYHPSYIMQHGRKYHEKFVEQIKKAKELLNE